MQAFQLLVHFLINLLFSVPKVSFAFRYLFLLFAFQLFSWKSQLKRRNKQGLSTSGTQWSGEKSHWRWRDIYRALPRNQPLGRTRQSPVGGFFGDFLNFRLAQAGPDMNFRLAQGGPDYVRLRDFLFLDDLNCLGVCSN